VFKGRLMRCGDLPVIAALILLVIVVVSSIAVYLFTQGYVLRTRREDSERFSQVVKIEGYSTVNYKNCILFKLYVRNVGKYPVEISSAYLDSSHGTTVESYFSRLELYTLMSSEYLLLGLIYLMRK